MRREINVIAAVGRRGQLAKNGVIPWKCPEDLAEFAQRTKGGVLVCGGRTHPEMDIAIGGTLKKTNRALVRWDPKVSTPWQTLTFIENNDTIKRPIWIIGGAHTYMMFRPYVSGQVFVNVIGYDNAPEEDDQHIFFPLKDYDIML